MTLNERPTPEEIDDHKNRAEFLHKHGAPLDWIVLTIEEVRTIKRSLASADREIERLNLMVQMIEVLECPNCKGVGWYMQYVRDAEELEKVECQICADIAALSSSTASDFVRREVLEKLLRNQFPHDLLEIRRKVGDFESEDQAKEELESYCTADFCEAAVAAYREAISAARAELERTKL